MIETAEPSHNLHKLIVDEREIYLLGTAHVSKSSVEEAINSIQSLQPDTVAVELCESRFKTIRDPDRWKNTDIVQVIREGRTFMLLAQLMLSSFQRKLGAELEVKPGAEMIAALDSAESIGATVVLADRDIRTTLKRAWSALSFRGAFTVLLGLLKTLVSSPKISKEEIERMKQSDVLEDSMREFSQAFPELRIALIDERDRYLAAKIRSAPGKRILAVVGAGHVPGIKSYINADIDLAPLEAIPSRSPVYKAVGWAIPVVFLALVAYGFITAGANTSVDMIEVWVLVNGTLSALGALVALAHPLTILTAFIVAPFTSLNPFIAAGWVAGLVEAVLKKPRVSDMESIYEDISTFRGIWRNRLLKILMIVALTNLFGTVGSIIGIQQVASLAV